MSYIYNIYNKVKTNFKALVSKLFLIAGLAIVAYYAFLNITVTNTASAASYTSSNLSTMQSCPRDANCYYSYYYDCVTFAHINVAVYDVTVPSTPVDVSSQYRNQININTQKNPDNLWKVRMTEVGPNGEDTCRVSGLSGGIWTGDKCNTQYEQGASYYASGKPGDDLWCFNGPFKFDVDVPAGYELVRIENNGHGTISGNSVSNINICGTGQSRYTQTDRDYQVYIRKINVNKPPVCEVSANPNTGTAPLDVTFTLNASDPDNDTLQKVWTVCGEQVVVNGNTYTTTIANAGTCKVSVKVTDTDGASDTCDITVNVNEPKPSIKLEKSHNNLTDKGNGEYEVEFEIKVTNTGEAVLHDIQVTDDLTKVFSKHKPTGTLEVGDYKIIKAPESTLGANPSFNGDTDKNLLDIKVGSDTLAKGESQLIKFSVRFKAPKGKSDYKNLATVTADTTENNKEEKEVTDEDPTEFEVNIDNKKPVCELKPNVTSIKAGESATFTVTASDPDGSISSYEWFVNNNKIDNDNKTTYTSEFDNAGTIKVKVVVKDNDQQSAECETEITVSSLKPSIDLQKDHKNVELITSEQAYKVDFDIVVKNTGEQILHDIQVTDDLTAVFGKYTSNTTLAAGEYTITSGPTSTLGVNTKYNGDSDKNLLDITIGSDTLKVGESQKISLSIKFKPTTFVDIEKKTFTNTAKVTADTTENNKEEKEVSDEDPTEFKVSRLPNKDPVCTVNVNVSTAKVGEEVVFTVSANDPDGQIVEYAWELNGSPITNNSNSYTVMFNNAGTYKVIVTVKDNDGKTANCENKVTISQLNPKLQVEKTYKDLTKNDDYSYNVTFVVTMKNIGDAILHDIQAVDDLTKTFGSYKNNTDLGDGQYTIVEAPTSALGANSNFNGDSDKNLLDITKGSDTLKVGESQDITFRIKFKPKEGQTVFDNYVKGTADTKEDNKEDKEVDDDDNTKFEVAERDKKKPICEVELEDKDGKEIKSKDIDEYKIPQKFYFDAGGSKDTDGNIKEYKWEVKKDGKVVTDKFDTGDKKISYEFTEPGKYLVSVKVVDNDGLSEKCDEEFELKEKAKESHLICQENACVEVNGSGANECSVDTDCRTKGGTPVPETGFADNYFSSALVAVIATMGLIAGGMYLVP